MSRKVLFIVKERLKKLAYSTYLNLGNLLRAKEKAKQHPNIELNYYKSFSHFYKSFHPSPETTSVVNSMGLKKDHSKEELIQLILNNTLGNRPPIIDFDTSFSALPEAALLKIQDHNILVGDRILFTRLQVNNNRVYTAYLDVDNVIKWTRAIDLERDTAAPFAGDTLVITKGPNQGRMLTWEEDHSTWVLI